MKKVIILGALFFTFVSVAFAGYFIQNAIYDNEISKLENDIAHKQQVVDEKIGSMIKTDKQIKTDIDFLNYVFENIFTFYNLDEFKEAKETAVSCGLPDAFVERFFSESEFSNMYADAMLDVMCKYDYADIYLLEKADGMSYYYATVKLDMVKYNRSFELAFFITLQDSETNSDRFVSVIYYGIT